MNSQDNFKLLLKSFLGTPKASSITVALHHGPACLEISSIKWDHLKTKELDAPSFTFLENNAKKYNICPHIIATQREIRDFITRGNKFPKFTNGWRNSVFGKDAEAILNSN